MIVAISRIEITSGNADAVAARYQLRSQLVEGAPGFIGLDILRGQDNPDQFLVFMRWVDRASFDAYQHSDLFKKAHRSVASIPGATRINSKTYRVETYDVITSAGVAITEDHANVTSVTNVVA